MPFTALKLHPSLLRGLKELGFARPTPIQADAIPPGLEGRDVLACAATGSGKTAAFLLPILQRLIDKPRGTTRALVLAPTRELAAQILENLNELSVHTPITGASVFGGVGMGPQEHAFRSGVDVIIATPGRLLDHLRSPYVKFGGLEVLVLDEADRMLDMGFLPEIRKILKHLPAKRQTLFFSATMPAPIVTLSAEMLHNAVTIAIERKSAPAVGITQAVYPVSQELKSALLLAAARARRHEGSAGVHAHEAPREPARRVPDPGRHQRRPHSRQPVAGAADRRAGRVQERPHAGARGHRHRRARHRRRGAGPRRELRRADGARRLHPPRRPHGARRGDRRGVHVRLAAGGVGPARHRVGDQQAAAARHRARFRLHGAPAAEARDPAGRPHRGDSQDEGRAASRDPR